MMLFRKISLCAILLTAGACSASSIESRFFEGDILTRNDRLATLPIEQQWRIYLYGNQKIHPPATGLAVVLARQGKPALEFILESLRSTERDLDFRDSMVVFQSMQWGSYYRVCDDDASMAEIRINQSRIRNTEWRRIYGEMLTDLCRSKQ